jgi:acyl carrier protein
MGKPMPFRNKFMEHSRVGFYKRSLQFSCYIFYACLLVGCLKSEEPLFTKQSADYPFKRNVVVDVYNAYFHDPVPVLMAQASVRLTDGRYDWTKQPVDFNSGPSDESFIMKMISGGRFILEGVDSAQPEYGLLVPITRGKYGLYDDICGDDTCAVSSWNDLVKFVDEYSSKHGPHLIIQIAKETDQPIPSDDPVWVNFDKLCESRIRIDDVENEIADEFRLNKTAITDDTLLKMLPNIDSIDFSELTILLEEKYDLSLDLSAEKMMNTPKQVVKILRDACSGRTKGSFN